VKGYERLEGRAFRSSWYQPSYHRTARSYPSQSLQDKSVDVASDAKVERPVKIYHVGGDVEAPRKISSPVPVIDSAEDKTEGKQSVEPGSTILRIVVGEDGAGSTCRRA
jgi:hypothetical protein